jgi:hypothetical protein
VLRGGGDKEKATKWDEISHTAGGNARPAVGLFGSFSFLCCSFQVLYGRTKFSESRGVFLEVQPNISPSTQDSIFGYILPQETKY